MKAPVWVEPGLAAVCVPQVFYLPARTPVSAFNCIPINTATEINWVFLRSYVHTIHTIDINPAHQAQHQHSPPPPTLSSLLSWKYCSAKVCSDFSVTDTIMFTLGTKSHWTFLNPGPYRSKSSLSAWYAGSWGRTTHGITQSIRQHNFGPFCLLQFWKPS